MSEQNAIVTKQIPPHH
jgi:hypothetical protein